MNNSFFKILIPVIVLLFSIFFNSYANNNLLTNSHNNILKTMPNLFKSSEFKTRVTSIIMVSEFKTGLFDNELKNILKTSSGIERTVILYSLVRTGNYKFEKEFVKSIPETKNNILELLDIEAGKKSYFSSPNLRIINYLGMIAKKNETAYKKIIEISKYADGWQGDSIMELIINIKEYKKN